MRDSNELPGKDAKQTAETSLDATKQQIADRIHSLRKETGPERHIPSTPLRKFARAELELDRRRKLKTELDNLPDNNSFGDAFRESLGKEIPKSVAEAEKNYDKALQKIGRQQDPLNTKIMAELTSATIAKIEVGADEDLFREASKSLSPSETLDALGKLEEQHGLHRQKVAEFNKMQETHQRLRRFMKTHRRRPGPDQ
jgi:hypothetical protein